MQSKYKTWLLGFLKVSVAICALYFVFSKVDLNPVISHFSMANMWLVLLAFILHNISALCSSLRSQYYLSCYGLKLGAWQAIYFYYVGMMFNIVLPGGIGGDGYRILAMHSKHRLPKLKALRVLLYERVSGFYILVLLGLCLFPYTKFYELDYILSNLLLFSLVAITPCYLWGVSYVLRDSIRVVLRAAAFSLGVQLLQVACVMAIIYSVNNNIDHMMLKNYILLFIASSIVAVIPISIGSVGLREITFFYGLSIIGIEDITYGVSIAMLISAMTIASGMLGIIPWLFGSQKS